MLSGSSTPAASLATPVAAGTVISTPFSQTTHNAASQSKRSHEGGGVGGGSTSKGFVDVLRSISHLTIANAGEIREEIRDLRRRVANAKLSNSISEISTAAAAEANTAIAELAALSHFLNEVVSQTTEDSVHNNNIGTSSSGEDDYHHQQQKGGGAVAVSSDLDDFSLAAAAATAGACHTTIPNTSTYTTPPRIPASTVVLGDAALIHYCLDFVVTGQVHYRTQLGQLALVCRQWRQLSRSERFWRPIALQLLPRLGPLPEADEDLEELEEAGVEGEYPLGGGGQQSGQVLVPGSNWYRRYLLQYGRCLVEKPIRMGAWHEGITLSFDLHDDQDGLRLFSSTGCIRFTGTTIPGITAMKLTGRRRRVTTAFSAASRDQGRGNFSTIEELFQEGDQPHVPLALTVRVTARDERTGRLALLFSSSKQTKRWVEPLGEDMGVPPGTLLVNQGWVRVTIPSTDLAMQMLSVFYVAPVESQEEPVDPADRLYSVLTLDCAFMLQCKTECTETIGRFVLAALENGKSMQED